MSNSEDLTIRVSGIVDGTGVDGPGFRTSIYFSGCRHACPGCHNPHTWDFGAGTEMTLGEILDRIDSNDMDVTFSGGDPMYSAGRLLPLARAVRERGRGLWIYTGFTWEELRNLGGEAMELATLADVLVDGRFVAALRDTGLLFRGSSNQRLIDVAATLRSGSVILYKPDLKPCFD